MFGDSNGHENYFTRICVSGLLNTRKIELCHMLLKDINMFHTHPTKLESNLKSAFTNSKVSNVNLVSNIQAIDESQDDISLTLTDTKSPESSSTNTWNYDKKSLQLAQDIPEKAPIIQSIIKKQTKAQSVDVNDSFFISSNSNYEPIRDELSSTVDNRHNISYIPLDDASLNYHQLQCLQNGFTAVVCLNETDVLQSNYLLNIKLEADNCTLVWSKPAWDLVNHWNTNNINPNTSTLNNPTHHHNPHTNNLLSVNKANNLRKSFVASIETSVNLKTDGYFRKKAASSPPSKFRNSHQLNDLNKYATIATSGFNRSSEPKDDFNLKYSINSLYRHYVQREYVNIDSFEGHLDLNSVKHIRLGCLDAQIYSYLHHIAKKYSINNFDQTNIISLVYGNVFSENK